jgi:hypothetical protein
MRTVTSTLSVTTLTALSALTLLAGCPGGGADDADTGTVQLNLVGQAPSGNVYRLRDGVITVVGNTTNTVWDTEVDPMATVFSENVPTGHYAAFLADGWHLEKIAADGTGTPVEAQLISLNPQEFDVFEDSRTLVALRFRVGDGTVDMGEGYDIVIDVEEEPTQGEVCSTDAECETGQTCCLAGFLGTCQALAPGEACPLPDLTISFDAAQASMNIQHRDFPAGDCAIFEGCVDAPGNRRLLAFDTQTPNIGAVDMVLGDPTGQEGFHFSECHGHYHFDGYATYELLDTAGNVAARGHKQAFCLLDLAPLPGTSTPPRYSCGFQGISAGWSDIYGSGLDCQWVDITEVAEGDYVLRININPDRILPEADYSNNSIEVPVHIGPDGPVNPGDPLSDCGSGGFGGPDRDCGWAIAQQAVACIPGEAISLGCGCTSGGTCGGDPVLRVCDGDGACTAANALTSIDDTCGLCPQANFLCPASGVYTVLTGAFSAGTAYTCEVAP